MRMIRSIVRAACVGAFVVRSAFPQGIIDVGNHLLQPNMTNQLIEVFVTGGELVQGVNFNLQIADGGPAVGGTNIGPSISAVFLLEGTIFAGNNTGQQDPGSFPQLAIWTVSTATGFVQATGLLAKVVVDTTGFQQGTWPFALQNTLNGPTDFAGKPARITDGSITVIPEPSTKQLIAIGGPFFFCLDVTFWR